MCIKLIVFDLDGTLINSQGDLTDSVNELRRRFGLKNISGKRVGAHVGQGVEHLLHNTIPERARLQDPNFYSEFSRIYQRRCTNRTRLFPGTLATLKRLSGIRLVVASNKPGRLSRQILRGLKVHREFSTILGADDIRRRKPHPEVILKLMRRFKAKPKETLMVGDSRFDMEAGKRARCWLCACTFGFSSRSELTRWRPDYTISRFSQLLKVVQQLQNTG